MEGVFVFTVFYGVALSSVNNILALCNGHVLFVASPRRKTFAQSFSCGLSTAITYAGQTFSMGFKKKL